MKRPFFLITFAILQLVSVLLGLNDTHIYLADTSVPNDEVTSSEASHSSASATIVITTYAVDDGPPGLATSDLFLWET